MTDLELFSLIEECSDEVHDDGIIFIPPYKYQDFVEKLNILDSESGFNAYITTGGSLCVSIDDLEDLADDFDGLKKMVIEKLAV